MEFSKGFFYFRPKSQIVAILRCSDFSLVQRRFPNNILRIDVNMFLRRFTGTASDVLLKTACKNKFLSKMFSSFGQRTIFPYICQSSCLILYEAQKVIKQVVSKIIWGDSIASMDLLGVKNDIEHTYTLATGRAWIFEFKTKLVFLPMDEMVSGTKLVYALAEVVVLVQSSIYRATNGSKRM